MSQPVVSVRRTIRAPAARVFAAWVDSAQLSIWWGPPGVECIGVEVDARVGGAFRIGNQTPEGAVVWISGTFREVVPPQRLVFTWSMDGQEGEELVTVTFDERHGVTEVHVRHERIHDPARRESHRAGWEGCLLGLQTQLE